MKLENKTILITGGTSGIGEQLGRTLKDKGNTVILMGRNPQKLHELGQLGFITLLCDLNDQDQIEDTVLKLEKTFPKLDVLFNNAGVQYNYFLEESLPQAEKIYAEVQINLSSQIFFTQLLLPLLTKDTASMIVSTTSGLGAFPKGNALVYSATKAGMRNFTKGLRYQLRKTNIKVVEFIPPVTDTGMTVDRDEKMMDAAALVETIVPQLEKGKAIATIGKMRLFPAIAFFLPSLAWKIVND